MKKFLSFFVFALVAMLCMTSCHGANIDVVVGGNSGVGMIYNTK